MVCQHTVVRPPVVNDIVQSFVVQLHNDLPLVQSWSSSSTPARSGAIRIKIVPSTVGELFGSERRRELTAAAEAADKAAAAANELAVIGEYLRAVHSADGQVRSPSLCRSPH
eukprot:SAG11_NODE_80_length_17731_cov_13.985254_17_plen_112_part_00